MSTKTMRFISKDTRKTLRAVIIIGHYSPPMVAITNDVTVKLPYFKRLGKTNFSLKNVIHKAGRP